MADNLDFIGNKWCINHINEKVILMCEDCKKKACITCVSTTHKGHNLIGIKLLVQEKYNKLQDLKDEIKEIRIHEVRKRLLAAEQHVKKLKCGIQDSIQSAVKQGEYLKELVKIYTAATVYDLKEIEQN